MDAKIKSDWLAALRSGKYPQGKTFLLDGDGNYCCLGVLATIQGCDLIQLIPDLEERCMTSVPSGYGAGIEPHVQADLADRNDGTSQYFAVGRQSFAQIADHIEENL